ncbi:MAG: phosphoribosylformylglycinamidine cyclo-ligase [Saprospirales bacterium]|nr:MAG: phosphoribosylformylglycinamidine cyclo-ligase [Saprospirales bacterium]
MSDKLKYDHRGVSASKSEVHKAIKNQDKGLYPNAFCKILPDHTGGDENYCNLMHADTAGTKAGLAYLYWKETGDLSVWKGIARDAIVMNVDDMACVGCYNNLLLSSTIGRNKNLIPGEIIEQIIASAVEFTDQMAGYGVEIHLAGGETADVGDIVRTIDVGYTAFGRLHRKELIVNDFEEGLEIVGLASSGQTEYENTYNSGIGSNGLTSARHDLLSKYYDQNFKEAYDPMVPETYRFTGPYRLRDEVEIGGRKHSIGKLMLSPTRTFLPFFAKHLNKYKPEIKGIIHCTGGGLTKSSKFTAGYHVIKDNLLPVAPVFKLIQKTTNTPWREMVQVFNLGTRLEIYCKPEISADLIKDAQSMGIDADVIGRVEKHKGTSLTIKGDFGQLEF